MYQSRLEWNQLKKYKKEFIFKDSKIAKPLAKQRKIVSSNKYCIKSEMKQELKQDTTETQRSCLFKNG